MAIRLSSNRTVAEKRVSVEPCFPLTFVEKCSLIHQSGHQQHIVRTARQAARELADWMKDEVESGRADEREEMILKLLAA